MKNMRLCLYMKQHLECAAPKGWSKYTTNNLAFKHQYNLALYVCSGKLLYLALSNFYDYTLNSENNPGEKPG